MATMVNEETGAPVHMDVEENGIAIIRLNQPGKPVNVISAALVAAMDDILRRIEEGEQDGSIRAAAILSEKKGTWIAGADIEQFKDFKTAADGEAASRAGQQLLNRLERLRVPVVAAIDGAALGGGMEVALACTYRIASDSPKTKLGLPEVNLGIVPGAGGTQRLPRLIGLRAALDLMLTGKQLDGRRARSAGRRRSRTSTCGRSRTVRCSTLRRCSACTRWAGRSGATSPTRSCRPGCARARARPPRCTAPCGTATRRRCGQRRTR